MVHFGEFLKTSSLRSNSVTRQVNFKWTKIGRKCQNSKIQMLYILRDFQTFADGVSSLTTKIGVIPDPESFLVVLRHNKFWLGEDLVVFVVTPVELLINFLDASFILVLHRTMYMKIHNPDEQLKTICRYSKT